MINRAVLVGRLTKDVEVRKTQSGLSLASFTVACDRPKKRDEQESQADFIRCVAWKQTADFIGQYGKRGMVVGVDGRIQTGSYQKDGITFYTTDIMCDTVRILESKKNTSEPRAVANESHTLKEYAGQVSQDFGTGDDEYISDGDLPF